jgi:hypothetical protein
MFRPLASLSHFKIHPPLPLSARESKQLLNLLTTSFRQQLDREHGPFRSTVDAGGKAVYNQLSAAPTSSRHRRPAPTKANNSTSTDRHLHSILTNPIFSYTSKPQSDEAKSSRDPMDVFDEACAKGFMNLEYAAACLKAKKNLIVKSSVLSVREAMKESGAGTRVLRWLLTTHGPENLALLKDRMLLETLVDFLVAEDRQAVVWTWLKELAGTMAATEWSTANTASVSARQLLYLLVKAEATGYGSLDASYTWFTKAKDMFGKVGHSMHSTLRKAGQFLTMESTWKSSMHLPATPAAFEGFLDTVPAFTARKALYKAHLALYHPSKPDFDLAIEFLRTIDMEHPVTQAGVSRDVAGGRYPDSLITRLGLDCARVLLEQDKVASARWVMDFLQERYFKQLGIGQKKQIEQAQAEASSLELLRSLNLA